MSEPMALERLVEQLFILRGLWTRTRVPIRTRRGSYSDLDVLAVKKGHVVAVECKGVGSKDAYRRLSKRKWTENTIRKVCRKTRDSLLLNESNECRRLGIKRIHELYFVLPGFFSRKEDKEVLAGRYSKYGYKITVRTIDDVLQDLWEKVSVDYVDRGKRYNVTALEMMRWMFRSRKRVDWPQLLNGKLTAIDERK